MLIKQTSNKHKSNIYIILYNTNKCRHKDYNSVPSVFFSAFTTMLIRAYLSNVQSLRLRGSNVQSYGISQGV